MNAATIPLPLWLIVAAPAYLFGCINGAILASKFFYHDDVRTHGSGNAGLTNFYRSYGAKYVLFVVGCDMGKAVLTILMSVLVAAAFGVEGVTIRYWAALFCIIGHVFPVTERFHGGKGVLCGATLLLLLDWRIGLVSAACFFSMWLPTKFVSLGSVAAALAFPVTTWLFHGQYAAERMTLPLSVAMAALVVWAHRENIKRLLHGTESKTLLTGHKAEEKK